MLLLSLRVILHFREEVHQQLQYIDLYKTKVYVVIIYQIALGRAGVPLVLHQHGVDLLECYVVSGFYDFLGFVIGFLYFGGCFWSDGFCW